jgi:hypothetical protein
MHIYITCVEKERTLKRVMFSLPGRYVLVCLKSSTRAVHTYTCCAEVEGALQRITFATA